MIRRFTRAPLKTPSMIDQNEKASEKPRGLQVSIARMLVGVAVAALVFTVAKILFIVD
jgi:hypothetical protein